ncbi:MAG: phosphoadenosine phosphosulfate reductase family protein [Methylibium sp.]|nr:phosphoadenosine phosphosulfate reductase family protein [Methylibium sp.]
MDIGGLIRQHAPRVALQFSGGRDSLAMLLLLREWWPLLTVYYTNSGDPYPETTALIDRVRAAVPSFVDIQGDMPETVKRHGWPSDAMQAGAGWPYGAQQIAGHLPLIDRHACCYHSIMLPMHERMQRDGITLLLRGQRDDDEPKSHVRSGETHDGMTIVYPLVDWSAAQVDDYIRSEGMEPPPYYAEGATSAPDCMRCTAWLEHGALAYLRRHHPATAAVVSDRLRQIKVAVAPHMARIDAALEEHA